ncbi:MAG: RNA polymerase sigma factor [Ilumatobacter sp.]|uniref:RNA polymerase sigma factor n=1 Tax=Ilumatobacter sp. TaxID=1967498 RepID=UPI003C769B10
MTAPLEEAYRLHADELVRYATALVGPDDAHDVVLDTMVKVFDARGDEIASDADQHLRAYLYKAVYTGSLDLRRSRARRQRRDTAYVRGEPRSMISSDASIDARRALDRLSDQQRTVAFLTYWCDHSAAEIATILEVSEGTVRKQLARARARLRKVLDV